MGGMAIAYGACDRLRRRGGEGSSMSDEEWPGGRASSSTDLEAADWCFRLQETPTEALLAEFQSWVAASKTNAEAFANAMLVEQMTTAERERIEQPLGQSLPDT